LHERLDNVEPIVNLPGCPGLINLDLAILAGYLVEGRQRPGCTWGTECKERKIGSLSLMRECGHRNYRKLDHLSTNSGFNDVFPF